MRGSSIPVDVGLAYLRSELKAAQRRSVFLGLANAGLVAVVVALGLFCLLRVLVLLWPNVSALRLEWAAPEGFPSGLIAAPAGHVVVAASIALAVFVLGCAQALADRPRIEALARRGDRTFALSERLSTAIEVERRSDRDSVSAALLRDVADRARAVGRRALVPFRVPALAGAAIILVAAAVALPAPGAFPQTDAAVSAPAVPALEAAERTDVAEDVRRVAALVAADAERRSDPYLAAIARELETIAEDVTVDPTLERRDIADALRRLVPYANQAYAAAAAPGQAATNLAPLIEAAAMAVETPAAAPQGLPPGLGGQQQAAAPATGPNGRPPTETLDRMLDALERPGGPTAIPTPTAPMPGGDGAAVEEASYAEPWTVVGAPAQMLVDPDAIPGGFFVGGTPTGAAAEAGINQGDAVGGGTRPLENGALTEFGALPQPTAEMMLADTTEGNGRRIRLEAPPEATAGGILPGAALAAGTGWRTITESPVSRTFLPIELGGLLSRYFAAADPNQ